VSGAFTGAQSRRLGHFIAAQGGTLFLDELAKASKPIQQKLLHAIEYGEVVQVGAERPLRTDVRIVAATNVSLQERVDVGEFLPDLLSRFGHFRVEIPPLRERPSDIVPLAEHFVASHAPRYGYREAMPTLTSDLCVALENAAWPGNVRELDGAVQYLLVAASGARELGLEHCTGSLSYLRAIARSTEAPLTPDLVRETVESTGSVSGAARKLGTARTTVYRYLRREGGGDLHPGATRQPVGAQ
jgi:DNA-binding NtrC family response regulator